MLAILISLLVHSLFLTISLRCLQDSLSSPRVDKLLQLSIVLKSFFFEKGTYVVVFLLEISSNRLILTWKFWAELNNLWRASYKLSSLIYGQLLNYIALVAGYYDLSLIEWRQKTTLVLEYTRELHRVPSTSWSTLYTFLSWSVLSYF